MSANKHQQRRRRKYHRQSPRQPDLYELIDGNWSYYPVAYCDRKRAYMTLGQVKTHKCKERQCNRLCKVQFNMEVDI